MDSQTYRERRSRCSRLMQEAGFDVLLLSKPANMFYMAVDGRLCAFCMITREGNTALGVPMTDVEAVQRLAHVDHVMGVEDEVGMIHGIAHSLKHFEIDHGVMALTTPSGSRITRCRES